MPILRVQTLGGLAAETSAGERIVLRHRKAAAVLAFLAVESRRDHSREELIALLWPETEEGRGRANLRQTLVRLRASLPATVAAALEAHDQRLGFASGALDVDLDRFCDALDQGAPHRLEEAAELYRGPFLAGVAVQSEAFTTWVDGVRRLAEERIQIALRRLLDHYVAASRSDLAIGSAHRLLGLDPLQESVHRTLIELYCYQGRYAAALAQYQRCREVLQQELGIEPDEETEALHGEILAPGRQDYSSAEMGRTALRSRPKEMADTPGIGPTVAVLPFVDASPGGQAGHVAIGLTEELITALTRFRELQVMAAHSAFAYNSTGLPANRARDLLGVRYRLEGSVQLVEDRLRATARLIETETGRHVWADRVELNGGNLFEVQEELTRRIVATLVGRLEGERLECLRRLPPADWQAQDFWLKGRAALRRIDFRSVARARHYFRRALELEPNFAPAHAGLAMTEMHRWSYFNWQPSIALTRKAYRHARRAAELDATDHRAQCILGFTYLVRREFEAARRHLDRALELNPNDTQTLAHVCMAKAYLGEPEMGVEAGELALRLDPYHPDWYSGSLGAARFMARDYEGAVAELGRVPEAICDTPAYLAAALAHLGRPSECAPWRDAMHRQYEQRRAQGELARDVGCIDWLISINPFRLSTDREHFIAGLRMAGIDQ
jgi:DNA-binding SARP family transcriptional activator